MAEIKTALGGTRTSNDPTVAYTKRGLSTPPQFPTNPDEITDEVLDYNLKGNQQAGKITGYTITGVGQGSIEERILKYYVVIYGVKDRWGYEYHARLPVGIHPKDAALAERGQVILQLSPKGHVTAHLVSRGTITLAGSDDVKQLAPLLEQDFGILAIKNDGVQLWLSGDLQKVHQAFLRIPPEDRPLLKGITLIRVKAASKDDPCVDAFYRTHQQLKGSGITAADDVFEFQVGNGTFDDDKASYVGRPPNTVAPASFHTILHEVGHAVEGSVVRVALDTRNRCGARVNQLRTQYNNAKTAAEQKVLRPQYDELEQEYKRLDLAYNIARGTYGSRRLDNFVAFVQNNGISPRITQYAADSWDRGKPGEFYAETYSLWRNDPAFVRVHSEKLFTYFDKGGHRNDK